MTLARRSRSSRALSRLGIGAALGVIGMTACSNVRPNTPARPVTSCIIGARQPNPGDTLIVATTVPVDWAHVPEPTNGAERLAFAQVYETLIDIDCEGHVQPALAASWTLDATKTRITLSLRKDATFWTGQPVTANDVLTAWRATAVQATASARLAREVAGGTTVINDNTLIVSLPDTEWMVLASPALAVYEQQATAPWAQGSGPYRIAEQSAAGGFALMPITSQPAPYLLSRRVPSGDPRDAIDAGTDVLVTDDPVAIGYANARPNLIAVPLPWSRAYAIAVPRGAPGMLQRPDFELASLRESLAHDAVHAEARAAQAPYWWQGGLACGAAPDSLPISRTTDLRSNRVVYARDDRIARGLAERFVAIERHSVAVGLAPNDLARALHDGADVAYVLDLPRQSLSSCDDFRELRSRAPWLASTIDADAKIVPLIDARERAILNRNRASATVDWSGTLHFSRP